MPKSRRRESISRRTGTARSSGTQSSQEEDELELSVTRSPVKTRSRLETHGRDEIDVKHCDFSATKAVAIPLDEELLPKEYEDQANVFLSLGRYAVEENGMEMDLADAGEA